ncbi:hypothetical protein I131_13370 [Enterococcus faecium CRL1879]|nr:hypothetical protein I131_13370 [Enterococcus faecium CRL1879]
MDAKDELRVAKLRGEGFGYKSIAKEVGVTVDQVKYYCRKNDLTGNRSKIDVDEFAEINEIKKSEMNYRLSKMMVDYLYQTKVISTRERTNAIKRLLAYYEPIVDSWRQTMARNKEVIKINAHRYPKMKEVQQKTGKLRVAAYARVSTELDNQTHSLIAQKRYYSKLIKENEDWEFAGLFADEGLSGTSFNKRFAFLEMVEKAEQGEIDFIITKSISRFARNTVDTLTTTRKLKALGVGIWFEKENVNTLDSKGEFIITLMSSLAQEESRSISENVTWGQRKRFAYGKATMPFSRCMGYDRGPNGEFVVNQEQAKVVKAMFAMAILGMTTAEIKKKLNDLGIPTAQGNKWDVTSGIKNILLNEKYVGDALLQKSFTVDYLSKKKKKNEGELPKYYVRDHHEAIVSREVFDYVGHHLPNQVVRRSNVPLSAKMFCEICGNYYGPRTWHAYKGSKERERVWQCQKRTACGTPHVYDELLGDGTRCSGEEFLDKRQDIIEVLEDFLGIQIGQYIGDVSSDRNDMAMIIEKIIVRKNRWLDFTFIDGSRFEYELGVWTPKGSQAGSPERAKK